LRLRVVENDQVREDRFLEPMQVLAEALAGGPGGMPGERAQELVSFSGDGGAGAALEDFADFEPASLFGGGRWVIVEGEPITGFDGVLLVNLGLRLVEQIEEEAFTLPGVLVIPPLILALRLAGGL
jgi:hypothetical protein